MKSIGLILLLISFQNCIAQSKEEIAWIKRHTIEISNDPNIYDDFDFLDSIVNEKRIVMLGENTHGASEYFTLKARMIKYLHEQLGFNILAWESCLLDCFAAESQKDDLTAKQMANQSLHFVYRTEEVLPVMQYLKESSLKLVGFDGQPTVYSIATAQFLNQNTCLGDSLRHKISSLDSVGHMPFRLSGEYKKSLAHVYMELATQVRDTDCTKESKDFIERGLNDRGHFLLHGYKDRDKKMSENLLWLLNEKYPNEKFIVYCHNAHNDPANHKNKHQNFKSMAEFLPDSVKQEIYNIGIFGYEGKARNNVKDTYEFKAHPKMSLENFLHQSGYGITFLDIANQNKTEANSFLYKKINTMYWGNVKNPKIISEHYDGVILLNSVSPSHKLQ